MKLSKIKSLSLILSLMISVSTVSFAQKSEKFSAKEFAQKKTERMKECLDLTKKQEKQVYDINLNFIENCQKNCPKFKGECPRQKGNCPKVTPNCPKQKCDSAKFRGECPKMKGNCPKVTPNCPKQKCDSTKFRGECPKMKGNCPKVTPNCPKQKCDSAKFRGECPKMKGNCPKVNPNCRNPKQKQYNRGCQNEIFASYNKQLKEVLTAAQYEKWMKMKSPSHKGAKYGKQKPCQKK